MACIRRFLAVVAFLALASLSVMVCPVAGDCYTPDGEPYGYHQGCVLPTEGMMTSCCATLDLCLDNLLCAHMDNNGNETYYRGTCSNSPNWTLPNCPNFCKGHTVEDSHDGEWPVGKCPSDGKSADRWFCIGNETGYGTVDNCTDPSFGFTLSGDTQAFWTSGIQPSYSEAAPATPTVPGTSTVFSWRGTVTASSSGSTSASVDSQPPTSLQTSSPSSEVQMTSSSTGSPLSSTSVVQPTAPISTDQATVTISSAQPISTPEDQPPTPSTSVAPSLTNSTESDSIPATTAGNPVASSSSSLLTEAPPPPLLSPQSTDTAYPWPTSSVPDATGPTGNIVPAVVGITVGAVVAVSICAGVFLYLRNRNRHAPARAEIPPPYEGEELTPTPQPGQAELAQRRRSGWDYA